MVGEARPATALTKRGVYEAPTLSDIRPTMVLLIPADAAIAAVSLYLAHLTHYRATSRWTELWQGNLWGEPSYTILLALSLPALLTALHLAGAYKWRSLRTPAEVIVTLAKAVVLCVSVLLAAAFVLRDDVFWRDIVFTYATLAFVGALFTRLAVRRVSRLIYSRSRWMRHTIIVGTGRSARAIADFFHSRPHLGFRVIGYVSDSSEVAVDGRSVAALGSIEDLPRLVDSRVVDAVVAGVPPEKTSVWQDALRSLGEVGTPIHVCQTGIGALSLAPGPGAVGGVPFVTLSSGPAATWALAVKRAIDLVGSTIGLVVLTPLMLVIASAIRLTSHGPALFIQERVGLNGRRFRMLKFRSMECDAEAHRAELAPLNEMSGPAFKIADDPRVTRVGRWIRRLSLDELPQLWNVLVGDMSLVGPRPPLPEEVDLYDRWQRRRLSMRPGITCLWQISGRNHVGFDAWMKLDMEYIDTWSPGLDLRILLRTIPAVLTGRGAS